MKDAPVYILAGGKSSRMGEDKGLMSLFGKPMVAYVIEAAQHISSDINLVTSNADYAQFNLPLISDRHDNKGPLSGIHAALSASDTDYNFVIPCDVPYVKPGLLKFLLYQADGYDITIPRHDNRIHPLMGVYRKECLSVIEKNISVNSLKVSNIFDQLIVNIVETDEFDPINFKNLNSKKDIVPF